MRTTLIEDMQRLSTHMGSLPHPYDRRGFYTATQMAQIIGRPPRWTDGTALHLLNWRRTVRKIKGTTQRVWFPPVDYPDQSHKE